MRDATRLAVVAGVFGTTLTGWAVGGGPGAASALILALAVAVVPWRGQPLQNWMMQYLTRNRPVRLVDPVTVANDRSGGGVRFQDGIAIAVVQLLGKAHRPTLLTGSADTRTVNTLDIGVLVPMLRQSMGLTIESASIVSAGARRRNAGDYPRIYDTLLGTAPYAGRRETWLVVRIRVLNNGAALRRRPTVGTSALAAAQRIAATLCRNGVRTRVATAADIVELERRLGVSALEPHNRHWHTLRGEDGWMTSYAYRPDDLTAAVLAQAWSLRADGIVQDITVFPDGTACATVTIRTAQPPTAVPSVVLKSLPGEQARAFANNLCGPRNELRGQSNGPLPASLSVPIGPSGILLGKLPNGDRMQLPLGDPGEFSRIRVTAEDAIAKRIVIRAAAAGERVTVHSRDIDRWNSVRMPGLIVTDQPRPAPGTTFSVTDGTVAPTPRPGTVIEVGDGRVPADIVILQTGPATVEVRAAGGTYEVEIEYFRAENRYLSSYDPAGDLQTVDSP